jgi:hypothetical protein
MVDENLKRISRANFWVVRGHELECTQGFFFFQVEIWLRKSFSWSEIDQPDFLLSKFKQYK